MDTLRFICTFIFLLICIEPSYASNGFTLTTTAFASQGKLPNDYACDGKDISPALSWSNPPTNAKSLVLILSDPDAPNGPFYHWIVYNLPITTKSLVTGATDMPIDASVGVNDWGGKMYRGPCPPPGENHHYIFTLYALDTKLSLDDNPDARAVLDAIKDHVLSKTTLMATYSH